MHLVVSLLVTIVINLFGLIEFRSRLLGVYVFWVSLGGLVVFFVVVVVRIAILCERTDKIICEMFVVRMIHSNCLCV